MVVKAQLFTFFFPFGNPGFTVGAVAKMIKQRAAKVFTKLADGNVVDYQRERPYQPGSETRVAAGKGDNSYQLKTIFLVPHRKTGGLPASIESESPALVRKCILAGPI